MKLKYERFEGVSCLYVRGDLTAEQLRLLTIGLETICKDLDQTLVINAAYANMDPSVVTVLTQVKKKLQSNPQKIYWVCKDKHIGDFPTIDLFASRLTGFKFRQIGDRIKLDDEVFSLAEKIKLLEAREKEIEAGGHNPRNLILDNLTLKQQKRILVASTTWHEQRLGLQQPVVTEDAEVPVKTKEITDELQKLYGAEFDL